MSLIKRLFYSASIDNKPVVRYIKKSGDSFFSRAISGYQKSDSKNSFSELIESLANTTDEIGERPLWSGYTISDKNTSTRRPNSVRTTAQYGGVYSYLVREMRPGIVLEIGTAFGVSGMYFLSGLELNGHGKLITFEPNEDWRSAAISNLSKISDRYTSILGTFEEKYSHVNDLGKAVDIAFVDGIHEPSVVVNQINKISEICSRNALIIVDDIFFSDNMRKCWKVLARDSRFRLSAQLDRRVGVLELK